MSNARLTHNDPIANRARRTSSCPQSRSAVHSQRLTGRSIVGPDREIAAPECAVGEADAAI
jgi:hypothetical protein